LKGTDANQTPLGAHRILARVATETLTSERVAPPVARGAPGGHYLEGVLYTQYFTDERRKYSLQLLEPELGLRRYTRLPRAGPERGEIRVGFGSNGTPVYIFA
jgi:hypothetical protein